MLSPGGRSCTPLSGLLSIDIAFIPPAATDYVRIIIWNVRAISFSGIKKTATIVKNLENENFVAGLFRQPNTIDA